MKEFNSSELQDELLNVKSSSKRKKRENSLMRNEDYMKINYNKEKNEIRILLNFQAIPASRPRKGNFGNMYVGEPYATFKRELREIFEELKEYGEAFIGKPIELNIYTYFKSPETTKVLKNELSLEPNKRMNNEFLKMVIIDTFKKNAPDKDNLEKAILDAIDGIFFTNDSFIVKGETIKVWNDESKIFLEIKVIDNNVPDKYRFESILSHFESK